MNASPGEIMVEIVTNTACSRGQRWLQRKLFALELAARKEGREEESRRQMGRRENVSHHHSHTSITDGCPGPHTCQSGCVGRCTR